MAIKKESQTPTKHHTH